MNMIERNYRTWCAQNDIPLEDGPPDDVGMEDEEVEDEQMDIDNDEELPSFFSSASKTDVKRKSKGKVADLVRAKIRKVLEETGLGQQRAAKCDEANFLTYEPTFP